MNPWVGYALVLVNILATVAIRAPHGKKNAGIPIAESRRGGLEIVLLALVWIAFVVLPMIAIFSPLLRFADYSLHPVAFLCGALSLFGGIYTFYRSHADLGTNWSVSLEMRETHELITTGIYQRVRHPMYSAIFLQAFAQLLLLPNWIAGPSYLVAFLLMFALRVGAEERMMVDRFGDSYREYMRRTQRIIPGIW